MNSMEKNIIKLMQATLGEVEFTGAIQNRISQRFYDKRRVAEMQTLEEQLPLFPEVSMFEEPKSTIETELVFPNFLWDFIPTTFAPEKALSEQEAKVEELTPLQLMLPEFESHQGPFDHVADTAYSTSVLLPVC